MNHLSSDPSGPALASPSLPRIGITMGDPAGIGPEVVLKAVAEEDVLRCCQPIIIGDAQLLAHNARTLDLQCGYQIVRRGEPFPDRITSPLIFHLSTIEGHVEPVIEAGSEGGLFGIEEASEIMPAVESCRTADGINVRGPFSADTVFLRASRGEFDAVVACYHDQAMIPVKCLSFGEAVNITLGLPFIRTSVDHGTAFDIAGKGIAEHSSMVEAIKLAAELSLRSGETGQAVEAA